MPLPDVPRSILLIVAASRSLANLRGRVQRRQDLESIANLAWLLAFRGEVEQPSELASRLGVDEQLAQAALDELVRSHRVSEQDGKLVSSNVVVPLGADQGWETAILDHFRTVAVAIATKIRTGSAVRTSPIASAARPSPSR